MGKWWQSEKEPDKKDDYKDDDKFELKPKEVKEKLDKLDGFDTRFNSMDEKLKSLDAISDYIKEQKAEKEKATRAEATKKANEHKAQTDTELEEEFLTDPASATRRLLSEAMNPLVETQINTAARLQMKELFENDPDRFEYATDPTIKKEIETHVASLPLAQRANPAAIENCYYVATGRHQAEIKEGKIKSRTSAVSSSGSGSNTEKKDSDGTIVLNDAEKKAAKVFGLKEEDYAKSKKELSYV